jgi:hypothetical protein
MPGNRRENSGSGRINPSILSTNVDGVARKAGSRGKYLAKVCENRRRYFWTFSLPISLAIFPTAQTLPNQIDVGKITRSGG